ncbi:alpha/beta hydrolase family protein [Euzebya tangerina]|uniref:S9 family peptidase n=1 Tax=Euzebya tangerina TaxID=591198 RepID=UPI000E310F3F|nr:S9 family peptidase [Euzebya tangerina]
MTTSAVAPYGTWPSPLSAADLAGASASFADVRVDGDRVLWLQSDPDNHGRYAVRSRGGDGVIEVHTPPEFNARTRVQEYGGGALGAGHGVIVASNFTDQRVYRLDGGSALPVTPEPAEPAGIRWAGMQVLPGGDAFLAVRETHGADRPRANINIHGAEEAVNEIVRVDLDSGETTVLVTGPDFVGGPWVNPSGTAIAWVQWNHPDMPWDTAQLWTAPLTSAGVGEPVHIAGGAGSGSDGADSAVCDAIWTDDERLVFSDDPDGWWNVYAWTATDGVTRLQEEPLDSGIVRWAVPAVLVALDDGQLLATTFEGGFRHLRRIPAASAEPVTRGEPVDTGPYASIGNAVGQGDQVIAIAGGPSVTTNVVRIDPTSGTTEILSQIPTSPATRVGAVPEPITFPTEDGTAEAHVLYYPPTSASHRGPDDQAPPLIVLTHGGPTGMASTSLQPTAQYWASRGFAVVDVNYRGSVGYGRAYRDSLRGNWGLHDLTDCVAAARHLADQGLADPDRFIIEGGSAGGYTTLLALCTTDVFAAGGCLFGVSDLRALATDTHKFESRYLDSMVGSWPQEEQVYIDRSPITHVDTLRTPMIVLQGDEDRVVPPSQSEVMVDAMAERGIAHAYLLFEGEQHGFRQPQNVARSLEARLAFYGRILGFDPADEIDLPEFVPGT